MTIPLPARGDTDWQDWAAQVHNGVVTRGVNVADYGAVGDGQADDTAALANATTAAKTSGRPLLIPAGTYRTTATLSWATDGLQVYGQGPDKTTIRQVTNNIAIVRVGGRAQVIDGIRFDYLTDQPATNTAANGLEVKLAFMGTYRNLSIERSARGMYLPTGEGTNNAFSTVFDNIRVNGYSISAVDFESTNSFSTGCVWRNIYTHNNYSGTAVANTGPCIRFSFVDEMTVHQLNVEWTRPATDTITLYQCKNATVSSLHLEQITPTTGFGKGLVQLFDSSKLTVTGVTMSRVTIGANLGSNPLFRIGGQNCWLEVTGLNLNTNTISTAGTTHPLVGYDEAQTTGAATIRNAETGTFSSLSSGDTGQIQHLKRVNDIFYHRRDGDRNLTWGTAAPTTGTWAVGDRRWNTAPVAGGTPGWVCTTAGTPGTWKAMAALAA